MPNFIRFTKDTLLKINLSSLREIGREIGVSAPSALSTADLIEAILRVQSGEDTPVNPSRRGAPAKPVDVSMYYEEDYTSIPRPRPFILKSDCIVPVKGYVELKGGAYGFLRINPLRVSDGDAYVSGQVLKKFNLRAGDYVEGTANDVPNNAPSLFQVSAVNGKDPELALLRPSFDDLTPVFPNRRIPLVNGGSDLTLKAVELFSPLGFGQRALIVAPPKAGKTTVIKKLAKAIETNCPEAVVICLLIDERPEEVTDMERYIKSEVVYSTFDESPERHIRAAESVIDRAKRMVEEGKDVVLLMDSITKLTRAYNQAAENSGRTLSGGLDPVALSNAKRFFGAARNVEKGGSLTVISTALVSTGSRLDDVVYEEFKGTGNTELHLSRELSEKRIFPAVDIVKSGTRRDDLLLPEKERAFADKLRRGYGGTEDAGRILTLLEATSLFENEK